jgi:hypothetical protein
MDQRIKIAYWRWSLTGGGRLQKGGRLHEGGRLQEGGGILEDQLQWFD